MKQSTKRIFAATMAALVVAAAGTTLTTQLPQLTNNVVHAAPFPVVQVDVSTESGDAEGNYKFEDGMFKLLKRGVNYVLAGKTDKEICFFGTSEQNKTETYYATLDTFSSTNIITFQNSGAKLLVNVPKGTENHINSLNPNNLTITGSGKLYASSLGARGGLTIEDTTIETKVARNSDSWGGTCILSGSANVTYIGNGTYAPLKLGEDDGVHSLTLEDNAKLYCLQNDPDVASDGIVDGLQVFGDANITLQGNSYLEAEGKKSTSEYGSSGIVGWSESGITI